MIRRAAIVLALAFLFGIANRGAYKGFFSGDDLDTLSWNTTAKWEDFARGFVSPVYHAGNFRPTAHSLFHLWALTAGLHYPPYVATIQALHLINALLLFWLLRRLKFDDWPAAVGALFWVFHMSLYDTFWKPMYVYDVLVGTFALLTLLAWSADLYLAALLSFWLAIKAKEHGIFLAPVLLAYEYWIGGKRWKRLIPFFAISLSFGVQALLAVRPPDHPYRLRFSLDALRQTVPFYLPGVITLPLVWVWRDKRAWFGVATLAAMIGTLLFLPGRMFSAYLYVPLLGLAVCVAARASVTPRKWMAAALALWLAACFFQMRNYRRTELTIADESRSFFEQMRALGASTLTEPEVYVAEMPPSGLSWWGVSAIIKHLSGKMQVEVLPTDWPGLRESTEGKAVLQLSWNPATRTLITARRDSAHPDPAFLDFETPAPFWLLGHGWYRQEGNFRWTFPHAELTLRRPAKAHQFELRVNVNSAHMTAVGQATVKILFDGQPFGAATFNTSGWQTRTWPVAPQATDSRVKVTLDVHPLYRPETDPRNLGLAVGTIGFRGTQP